MGYIGTFPKNTTAVLGVPIGKINDLTIKVNNIVNFGIGTFPQMTQTQINALTPINGQTVYNSTTNSPQIYVAGSWYSLQLA